MKTDDDLKLSSNEDAAKSNNLINNEKFKRNYTERGITNSRLNKDDLVGSYKTKNSLKKTRNDVRKAGKLGRITNPHEVSNSSIFSLSNDDTYKSFDRHSKPVCYF